MNNENRSFLCSCRLKRSWFPFRRSEPTGSNTCWSARSGRPTASTWRACGWALATWAPWTCPRTTTDEGQPSPPPLHHLSWSPGSVHPSSPFTWPDLTVQVFTAADTVTRRHTDAKNIYTTAPEPAVFQVGQMEWTAGFSCSQTHLNFLPLPCLSWCHKTTKKKKCWITSCSCHVFVRIMIT